MHIAINYETTSINEPKHKLLKIIQPQKEIYTYCSFSHASVCFRYKSMLVIVTIKK